jgi:putative membrane protein
MTPHAPSSASASHADDAPALQAAFNPLLRAYLVAYVAGMLLMTVVLSPLAVLWLLGPGQWWAGHYFNELTCRLNDRVLNFRKGILFQVEKTIPLENIQDVTFLEGPLLRRFDLTVLRIETAGQSPGQAHNMQLAGIIDAHRLRDEILRRRDRLRRELAGARADHDALQLDALHAIRDRLDEIATLLRRERD